MQKLPPLSNLFLTRQQSTNIPPATCQSGHDVAPLTEQLSQSITSSDPKNPNQTQRLGAFQFEVRYDAKLVCVKLVAGPDWTQSGVICLVQDDFQNSAPGSEPGKAMARIGCLTTGKTITIDELHPLATIEIRPQPQVYSQLRANQDNGIPVQIQNQNCKLADVQGHDISIFSCEDADVTLRYLEGDLDADCIVSAMDTQQIAFRWGATQGSLLYVQRDDLSPSGQVVGDGVININDLQFVYGRFLSTCANPWPAQLPVNPKAP